MVIQQNLLVYAAQQCVEREYVTKYECIIRWKSFKYHKHYPNSEKHIRHLRRRNTYSSGYSGYIAVHCSSPFSMILDADWLLLLQR